MGETVGLTTGTAADARLRAERLDVLDERCRRWVSDEGPYVSIVALVARDGVVGFHRAYGTGHDGQPVDIDSVFPLFSLTKPFTATLALALAEDGVLGLTRSVREYLPEFRVDGADQVLVHHLLTHTAALGADLLDPDTWERVGGRQPTDHEVLELALQAPLRSPPGAEMVYQDSTHQLLGAVIARAGGRPLQTLADERVFGPLRMASTWYGLPEHERARYARHPKDQHLPDPPATSVGPDELFIGGSRAGVASAADVARLAMLYLDGGRAPGGRVLTSLMARRATTNRTPGIPAKPPWRDRARTESAWGYGWTVASDEAWPGDPILPEGSFCHSGLRRTFAFADRETGMVGVLLGCHRWSPLRFVASATSGEPWWSPGLVADHFTAVARSAVDD